MRFGLLHYKNVVVVFCATCRVTKSYLSYKFKSTRVSDVADLGRDDVREVQQGGASDGVTHAQAEKRETKQDRLKLVAYKVLADRIFNLT